MKFVGCFNLPLVLPGLKTISFFFQKSNDFFDEYMDIFHNNNNKNLVSEISFHSHKNIF